MRPEELPARSKPKPLLGRIDSEAWNRISAITDEAMELAASEVSAFLDRTCGEDRDLREAVERLLAADIAATGFLERPVLALDSAPLVVGAAPGIALAPGEEVAGRYRIAQLLGRGGMGEVYEAWDEELSISVALKTLRLPAASEGEAVRQLKRESLLTRAISHPNVCRVYDLGRHGVGEGALGFLTMEVLRGETLAERLQKQGRLPPESALPLVEHMAAGLGAAHQAGVVHRDFKPSNVMIVSKDSREQAVITDFGIARLARAGRTTGTVLTAEDEGELLVGTPAYIAPEQVRGERVGPAADIYALGIVLYEMLTGERPFAGGSAMDVAKRRLVEEPPRPRSVVPELDERWEAVILRCLAREPSRRFGRAEDVAEALAGQVPVEEIETLKIAGRGWHTLPVERDAFIGREKELEGLDHNLSGTSRLVTLLGPGGMGKTRLAARYGWRSLGEWPGGVWFCDLTEARDANGIVSAMAGSLGVPLGPDPIEQLGHAIAGRGRCLVILDNFEQIVEHAGETVSPWMARAVEARFLVTSRARLGLDDEEKIQVVEPLLPEQGLDLFTARARWLRPGLALVGEEAESAREVVRLVEGMPLALELAAARMRVMSASQIVEQMRRRFQLLTGGPGDRHETLAAVIDGSWELLRPWEKSALAQCSVFEGGFTLEAAEAVLNLEAWRESPWVVDVVQSLVDKSLLRTWMPEKSASGIPLEARVGMYESLQEYAHGKLWDQGVEAGAGTGVESALTVEERHGRWYARYGTEEAILARNVHGSAERQRAFKREIDNLVTACRRAVSRGDIETAAEAYLAVSEVLHTRNRIGVSIALAERLLESPMPTYQEVRVLRSLGAARLLSGQIEAASIHSKSALALALELGDRHLEGAVLADLGDILELQGRAEEAKTNFECTLAIGREIGHRHMQAYALHHLGINDLVQGRMDEALTHFESALAIAREVGYRSDEGAILGNLGLMHSKQGRNDEAREYYEQSTAIYREFDLRRGMGIGLMNIGIELAKQGRLDEARSHYEAALTITREIGILRDAGAILCNLGYLCSEQGQMEEAQRHYDEGLVTARQSGNRRVEGVILCHLAGLHLKQGRTMEARGAIVQCEAIFREMKNELELAFVLCVFAETEIAMGDVSAASAVFREAESLAAHLGAAPESELAKELARVRQSFTVKGGAVGEHASS
jgi:serine/threonine protein kinase/predicted ATPase/Flp pilus assembly protein TadD